MSISLCMIAKDEEDFIEKALKSAEDFVDEIIVVDTGSKDNTINIAKKYNAIIKESPWKKDFSFHRNESIELAKSDWIIFLDCDEVIEDYNKEHVKTVLAKKDNKIKGYNISVTNIIDNKKIASFPSLRIFKNGEGFKFVNPIHEQISKSITEKYGEKSLGYVALNINHYGYEEYVQKNKDKRKRNMEILNTIKNKDTFFYAMIGDEYLQANNLKEAKKNYKLSFENIENLKSGYVVGLMVNYISVLINLREYKEGLKIIEKCKENLHELVDLYFLEYWIYFYSKEYKKALDSLNEYINLLQSNNKNLIYMKNFHAIYNLNTLRIQCINILMGNQ